MAINYRALYDYLVGRTVPFRARYGHAAPKVLWVQWAGEFGVPAADAGVLFDRVHQYCGWAPLAEGVPISDVPGVPGGILTITHACTRAGPGPEQFADYAAQLGIPCSRCPEVTATGTDWWKEINELVKQPTVVAIGAAVVALLIIDPFGRQRRR